MFFAASKILVWLIYPLSLSVLLLIFAYGALLFKKRASFHILFLLAISMLYLLSIRPVSDSLLKPLERRHLPAKELKADAVVVLSGDIRKSVYPRSDIEVEGSRVIKAVRLFRQGAAPVMVMTGGSGDLFDQSFKEAVLMKELAVEFGVPADKILVEIQSRNTRENVLFTKPILDRIKAKKIILVTSAYHLPRAYALSRKIGIDPIPVAADHYVTDEKYGPLSFIPSAQSLSHSSIAIKEYAGLLAYWLKGWL